MVGTEPKVVEAVAFGTGGEMVKAKRASKGAKRFSVHRRVPVKAKVTVHYRN